MTDRKQILIVDDEPQMRSAMCAVLTRAGYDVVEAEHGRQALGLLEEALPSMVVSDMRMPELEGGELLNIIRDKWPMLPVVMITAYGTIAQAVEAMRNGAFDFITKPFSAEELENVVARAIAPMQSPSKTRRKSVSTSESRAIITANASMRRLVEVSVTIAPSSASVFIQGESGTGKELIARLIHNTSDRARKPFIAVNCAAVPANLLESEMFGHEKGSFTGALATKVGKFEMADGGTILLDEVSEMDAVLQAKLLRVLQEREIDRVGGLKPIPIDVRVVATTNRRIQDFVEQGQFREDLLYRLNVIPLIVPPLRQRVGDLRLLVEHFVRKFDPSQLPLVTQDLIEELESYPWPGNVRELENACQRAVLLGNKKVLKPEHFFLGCSLRETARPQDLSINLDDNLRLRSGMTVAEAEKRLIIETLRHTDNNKTKAADLLGISIRTLRNKLHEYGEDSSDCDAYMS